MVRQTKNMAQIAVNGKKEHICPLCANPFKRRKHNQSFCSPEHKAEYYKKAYEVGVKIMSKPLGKIHAADIRTSERLKNIYALLSDSQWHTGMDVAIVGPTTAPSSAIQELKHPRNGYVIESRCEKRTANNRPLWEYRLIRRVK
jgi:ribosomal protein L37AE/L43A